MRASNLCFRPRILVQALRQHSLRWVLPCIAITLLALAYALWGPRTWKSTQALSIREEAIRGNSAEPLGRFSHKDSMKAAQETIVQLASSHAIVEAALREVGPPAKHRQPAAWPTQKDIEAVQQDIKVSPPRGIEFGQTEVFYLVVSSRERSRSLALSTAICNAIENRWQRLREENALGLIAEIEKRVELAEHNLDSATESLTTLERSVGSELGDLRILSEFSNGTSNLQLTLSELKNELRQAQIKQRNNAQLLSLILTAQEDPDHLVATPNPLLVSQPALSRLKNGLLEAQLKTASLASMMTEGHPRVQAAVAAEEEIRGHLRKELSSAARAISADLELDALRIADLELRKEEVEANMANLAELRARYANLVAAVNNRSAVLRQAEEERANAQASLAAALASSRLTRVDAPVVPSNAAGLGRTATVCLGLFGGLAAGLAILFLTLSPVELGLATGAVETKNPDNLHDPHEKAKNVPQPSMAPDRPLSLNGALARLLKSPPAGT